MNAMRAQEIANSPVMAIVMLNGERVYIQHVDGDNETARVYPLDDPSNEQNVHLSDLVEHE
ncbi:small, acid-soluble spore protein H [Siminovitchia terrae]|uniref:Small, acid-soluble spore protein H n=1 Tax=Siminovitchia terrae TaxID=1914933 RepID=A0A429X1Z8_SIMTE|nr:H-type small acid-soluble spore protein [Siminovitchia terrae]RST57228.1 H-type small acid-soluble spore protein [Siminovitchia terrae]GIN93085.1 small, acid-soluble spore protein H [Siminovitchia terrae]GIN98820.1 small, acid-soluble spore protein H [Siminovitchia terrae]